MRRYAIRIRETKKGLRYDVRRLISNGTAPVVELPSLYKTEQAAREAAQAAGLVIEKVGDVYDLAE